MTMIKLIFALSVFCVCATGKQTIKIRNQKNISKKSPEKHL